MDACWEKLAEFLYSKWYGATASPSTPPEFPSLSLKPLPNLDASVSSSILVRESYVTMFDTVWAKAIKSKGRKGVIITGQPGIGKTLFLYYLLVRLLQRKQIVLFSQDGEMLYLFYHKKVYAVRMMDVISASLPEPIPDSNIFIWSLLDIRRPEEPKKFLVNYPCLPVQTAPLNPIRYKIWSKEQTPLHTGLPLWTRDELAQGLQHQYEYPSLLTALDKVYRSSSPNLSDPLDVYPGVHALLEEHYSEEGSVQPSPEDALNYLLDAAIDRFGYSARDVFEAVFNYPTTTRRHERAFRITYADLYAAVSALSREESPDNSISNQILTLSPVDQGPLMDVLWKVDFKSSWVAKSVIQKLGEAEDDEIRRQIRIFRRIREAGALGYQKIREIIAILKDELGEEPPPKKSKTATGQAAALVQVRYLLVVPKDESQAQNLQWDFPKGWSQNREKNDHCGNVYCLEVPLAI